MIPAQSKNKLPVVLIAGASPDRINRNAVMRIHVREGFAQILGEANAFQCSLDAAAETIRRVRPDLVVCFGSCMPDSANYGPLRDLCDAMGAGLAFWLHDDPYEFDFGFRAEEFADWIFSNDRWATLHYSHPRSFHLPMAGSPQAHQLPWRKDKDTDVFFCGVAFANRIQIIRDLEPALRAVRARILGDQWPSDLPLARNQRLSNAELAHGYAGAWVTINMGRSLHLANTRYQLDPSTPGPRTFEAALAGTVQMYFADGLEICEYFEPDREILLFDGPDDFERQLNALLADPMRARDIAEAARTRALRDHTWRNRANDLLRHCGMPAPQAQEAAA